MSLKYTICIYTMKKSKKFIMNESHFSFLSLSAVNGLLQIKIASKNFATTRIPRSKICMIWFHCVCCVDNKIAWVVFNN